MREVGYPVTLFFPAYEAAQREAVAVAVAVGSGSIVIPPADLLEVTNNV